MNREHELSRENQALRDRLSRLSEASLRINESLDFDTVLQGVLDSARALTQARYGVATLLDDAGLVQDVLSSGFAPQEAERLWGLEPEGRALLVYLSRSQEPLRFSDLFTHMRSAGLPEFELPVQVGSTLPFLAAPVLYQGQRVGNFLLSKDGSEGEFTDEDEDTLVMFASQAALVIANARTHREEQRARADLETLIDTSPVGVIVFDAKTGLPVSLNSEAVRITSMLNDPGQPPEHLLDVLTVRRDDGQEFSLIDLPLAELFSAGLAVRAEEMELSVPDGRSVTILVNATPIRSEEGEVMSQVVTLQDMTPLEEIERLRAEFLAMVSHELRTPLATVRGSVSTLLEESAGLQRAEVRQFHQIILEQTDRMRALIADLLDVARIETGALSVYPEPTDLTALVGDAVNSLRVGGHSNDVRVDIPSDLPWVMADRSRVVQVLANLLANAVRHSPESTSIVVSAVQGDFHVSVSVSDEGMGIPPESLPHLFRKFSRIAGEEQLGDTGLGLAISKGIVEAHGGRIWAASAGSGEGARFTFTLPTVEDAGYVSPVTIPELNIRPLRRSNREQVRILAVDDDSQALRYIRECLAREGFRAISTGDPDHVPRLMDEEKPHLVLLDLMMPGIDGVDLMNDLRETRDVPVIFVSAYGQDKLIARAFEMGADDYVVKPFSPTELAARIRAALRRRETSEPPTPYVLGDLTINYAERLVTLMGRPVTLTAIEYRLLLELSANAGRVLTYEHLLNRVWDQDSGDVRPMRTAITSIRRKLGDDAENPTYIFTEHRVGYRMPRSDSKAVPPLTT